MHEIASLLKKGGVIAYPTDTLYALGGDAFNPDVHHKIRILKERKAAKPFPYIIDKSERLREWGLELSPVAATIASKFWPGPLSLVLEDSGGLPADVLDANRTICLRMPDSKIARAIAGALGGLVIATSANPGGRAPARTAPEAVELFRGEIDAVVDGGPGASSQPSTIVDVTGSKVVILREGAIPAAKVRAAAEEFERKLQGEKEK